MKIACPFVHPYVQTIVFVFRSYFAHNWGWCAVVGRLAVLLPLGGAWLSPADKRPPSLGAHVFFNPNDGWSAISVYVIPNDSSSAISFR